MTNSSKVMIDLSFLLFLISDAKRKILKSNKSELWNCLSYRGLPYFFEVGSKTFRKITKFRGCSSKFSIDRPLTSMTSKTALPYISKIGSNQCTEVRFASFLSGEFTTIGSNKSTGKETDKTHLCAMYLFQRFMGGMNCR